MIVISLRQMTITHLGFHENPFFISTEIVSKYQLEINVYTQGSKEL